MRTMRYAALVCVAQILGLAAGTASEECKQNGDEESSLLQIKKDYFDAEPDKEDVEDAPAAPAAPAAADFQMCCRAMTPQCQACALGMTVEEFEEYCKDPEAQGCLPKDAPAATYSAVRKNVKGETLQTCSTPGTALTGVTRDGFCTNEGDDDAGSHHICIQMRADFCTVTKQPNWCADQMPCMAEPNTSMLEPDTKCDIQNWCVCQWAFAKYIKDAGGCDAIVDLECDATNLAAIKAYEGRADTEPDIKAALDCLKTKCGLTDEENTGAEGTDDNNEVVDEDN